MGRIRLYWMRPARQCTTLGSHWHMTCVNTAGGISVGLGSRTSSMPPTNVSFLAFPLFCLLFDSFRKQHGNDRLIALLAVLDATGHLVQCKTRHMLPFVDVSLRVKAFSFAAYLSPSDTCRPSCRTFLLYVTSLLFKPAFHCDVSIAYHVYLCCTV